MDFLESLNPPQREAVLYTDGPLLILAGAGSGKTRVIAYRIAYLVGSGLAEPHEVLAVTFTNKAAEEMRARVGALVGTTSSGMWISTFHALCARLLRREAPHVGLSRDFVIYDSSDQLAAVKQILRDQQVDDSFLAPRAALSRISHAKNRMESPAAMLARRSSYRDDVVARVYDEYVKTLAASGALDFDDLLLKTVELFERAEAVRNHYSQRFRFVMVDEYQDTNRPQYMLMRRLAGHHRNLTVVGDPDQSIYAWRGADIRNILDFETDFPEARVVRLEQNYRSTEVILAAASALIANNVNRKEKRLWTDQSGGDPIVYARCGDELEEGDFVAKTARGVLSGDPSASAAVLYRTNAQSRVLEDALRRENLAYRIIGGVRFYERKEIKDTLGYLKLLLNPHDDVSLRRIINTPARGIGKGVMDAMEQARADAGQKPEARSQKPEDERQKTEGPNADGDNHALDFDSPLAPPKPAGRRFGEGGTESRVPSPEPRAPTPDPGRRSLWMALCTGLEAKRFPPRATASLGAFRDLVLSLTEMSKREPASTTIAKVLDQSGYLQDLREERSEEAEGRVENLAELVSAAREYRGPRGRALAGGICRPAVAPLGGRRVGRRRGRARAADDAARGEGPRIPGRHRRRPRGGPVPALALRRRRRDARGGAPPLLCGHDQGQAAAVPDQCRPAPRVRGVPRHRTVALPRRDPRCARPALRLRRVRPVLRRVPWIRGPRRGVFRPARRRRPCLPIRRPPRDAGAVRAIRGFSQPPGR